MLQLSEANHALAFVYSLSPEGAPAPTIMRLLCASQNKKMTIMRAKLLLASPEGIFLAQPTLIEFSINHVAAFLLLILAIDRKTTNSSKPKPAKKTRASMR